MSFPTRTRAVDSQSDLEYQPGKAGLPSPLSNRMAATLDEWVRGLAERAEREFAGRGPGRELHCFPLPVPRPGCLRRAPPRYPSLRPPVMPAALEAADPPNLVCPDGFAGSTRSRAPVPLPLGHRRHPVVNGGFAYRLLEAAAAACGRPPVPLAFCNSGRRSLT